MKQSNEYTPTTSTRRDIAAVISKTYNITQMRAYQIIDTTFEVLLANLIDNGHVELRGFGVFEVVQRKGRKGRNPKKPGEEVWIPERKTIRFKASRLLRNDLEDAKIADRSYAEED